MRLLRLFLILSLVFNLAACASSDKDKNKVADKPAEVLYNEAGAAMKNEEYKTAANLFDEVERQHPYSEMATQAKLMSAYASYQAEDYTTALMSLDKFIELHPGHPDIAYAYYLRAISYYEQITDVGRDQDATQEAMDALDDVIRRFPETVYARDAKLKRNLTFDHLAGKEMEIGRFYLRRNQYQAAIRRFNIVVEQYQTTTHAPEALHRMVECYTALGLTDEAQKMAAILGHNYPGSEWYEASYSLLKKGKTLKLRNTPTTTIGRTKNSITDWFEGTF
ncbi:MAG TPA: outer membrane protein assembly factor BamD [Alphaproteobacteria bacterium]